MDWPKLIQSKDAKGRKKSEGERKNSERIFKNAEGARNSEEEVAKMPKGS
jgi:hypothetical protein